MKKPAKTSAKKLGFIGAGNMAEALARGLLSAKIFTASDLIASDVEGARRNKLKRSLKIETTIDNLEVIRRSRTIVIAVKPQNLNQVLEAIRSADEESAVEVAGKLFISIAAGVTIARLEGLLGPAARVIRVMPNAPAMVGQGMAALVRGANASKGDEALALRLFRAVGDAIALGHESLLDPVTGLSGSGPAYVYVFIKSLADAGASEGLAPPDALRMTLQTIRGAEASMRESRMAPAELIRMVASPGGTTEAALQRFAEAGFSDIVAGAVRAATARSRELGKG
jgi:pyrroline-5-carboxylate reductase